MITYFLTLPHCFEEKTDYRTLSRVLTDIAYADNIFLVDFQGAKWKTYVVRNYLEKYTNQMEKRKVVDLLNLVTKKILKNATSIKIATEDSWILAGKEFSKKNNLGAVLSKKDYYDICKQSHESKCIDITEIDLDPATTIKWKQFEEKEKTIYRSESDYEDTLHSNMVFPSKAPRVYNKIVTFIKE